MDLLDNLSSSTLNVYIELTNRIHGGMGWDFGSVLWSPAYGRNDRDFWNVMRNVRVGDIIIHSLKGERGTPRTFNGLSIVKTSFQETTIAPPIPGRWECDKYYRIELDSYQRFDKELSIPDFLSKYQYQLNQINRSDSFYARNGRCAQKYLAPIPSSVLGLLIEYFQSNSISLVASSNVDEVQNDGTTGAPPQQVLSLVTRRIRDTKIIRELKTTYDGRCQICNQKIKLPNGNYYSEGHHIKQLGNAHLGPDIKENIIILCPFHHAEFDYGAIGIKNNKIVHIDKKNEFHNKPLAYNRQDISEEYLQYHMRNIFNKS